MRGFNHVGRSWTRAQASCQYGEAEGEEPLFKAGDEVKIAKRFPIGHFRVPNYIRGKRGRVEAVIEPAASGN
jgi:Nitrile hydratase beta subunit